jgi:hypothetical protein
MQAHQIRPIILPQIEYTFWLLVVLLGLLVEATAA